MIVTGQRGCDESARRGIAKFIDGGIVDDDLRPHRQYPAHLGSRTIAPASIGVA